MSGTDQTLTEILRSTRVIALVGYSLNPARASNSVARFLSESGWRVIPVNPGLAGQKALGEVIRAGLEDIPAEDAVDMVDIFRRSDQVLPVVEDALAHLPHLRTVWMQLGVQNDAAAALAQGRSVQVVANRCPAIEAPRLGIAGPR